MAKHFYRSAEWQKAPREAFRSGVDRPILPKPACRVMLVCGPVGSGKSSYVEAHKRPDDSVIDFDGIAREMGFGKDRLALPSRVLAMVLDERNRRMEALSLAPHGHTAWVTLMAPSPALRAWWCQALDVGAGDMVLLVPAREELERRIRADPSRARVIDLHLSLVKRWFEREQGTTTH